MKVTGGHRAGFRERGDLEGEPSRSQHLTAAGSGRHDDLSPELTRAVVAVLAALTTWNSRLFSDLTDSSTIRLQREIERCLLPLFPSSDGRKGNGGNQVDGSTTP